MATAFGVQSFLNIRSASGPTFSPDGRFVAFLTNITGVSQLWQVPVVGGWPVQLTFSRESVRSARYNPVKHELIYSMDVGGDERTQLHLLRGVGASDHGLGDGWASADVSAAPTSARSPSGCCDWPTPRTRPPPAPRPLPAGTAPEAEESARPG